MNIERIESAPAYMAGYSSAADYSLSWAERQAAAEAETMDDFLQACGKADANAMAPWAPAVNDYSGFYVKKRTPALHIVMADAMDYPRGPQMDELMQILLNVAHGDSSEAPVQARALLVRMAATWAKYNTPEVDA